MWNYSYVGPSLLVTLVFLAYYFTVPRLRIRCNRTFLLLVVTDLAVLAADVVSSLADEAYASLPRGLLWFWNGLFFVLFLLRAYLFYLMTLDALGFRRQPNPAKRLLGAAVLVVSELFVLSSPFTGAVFYIDDLGYHRGAFYDIIYYCFLFYILLTCFTVFRHRSQVSRYELVSTVAFNAILLAGIVIRFLFPRYLVMGMFCQLAIIVIFLSFENPQIYLSGRNGVFNTNGLRAVLEETIPRRPYRLLALAVKNYTEMRGIYGGEQLDRGMVLVGNYLKTAFPRQQVFYLRSGWFVVLGDGKMDTAAARQTILERFRSSWSSKNVELYLEVSFAAVSSGSGITVADKLLNHLLVSLEQAAQPDFETGAVIELDNLRKMERELDIKRSLERSLEREEVEIYLQPLIEGRSRTLAGAEVLCRIRDSAGNVVPPALFIPLAEKSGHINLLGEQVFEQACRFVRDHDLEAMGLRWLNVNLSPVQCMRTDLSRRYTAILERYAVPPERIHLEITEQSVSDNSMVEQQIEELKARGFLFSLDDYGSGYSNLTRVKRYPFFNIKLDMEVVWDYFRDRDELLPSLVRAFKDMDYSVTAEGIETSAMADVMVDIGCDFLQGYYFAQPLPIDRFVEKYAAPV